jgi:aminopeptidase N
MPRCYRTVTILFFALLVPLSTGAKTQPDIPLPQDRDLLWKSRAQLEPRLPEEKFYTPHPYDVLHYEINIDIDIPGDTVRTATVLIDCQSQTDTLSTVDLHFYRMTIDSIVVDGDTVGYTRDDDELLVHLDSAVSEGDTFQVAVAYHGRPFMGLAGTGLFISTTSTFTIGAPDGSYKWYPCWDHPSDKATADVNVTVPTGYIVASNGTLLEVVSGDGGTTQTYRWSEDYPISTYLICLTVYPYATFSLWYEDGPDTMEIPIWVRPPDSAKATVDFANLPEMIACYQGLFGPYPFIEEKYGMAWFPWSGAMEHQTCTSYGFPIPGDQSYDHVVAHELSHQWWGDWVTYGDYCDVWLNEGFATYCEALWWEHLYGEAGLYTYMEDTQDYYIDWEKSSGHRFPIYDPPLDFIYCPTTYEKAASVLHMLRFLEGDSVFFEILRTYGTTYAYDIAVTADFQAVCETVSGQDLDWFFDQWIYDQGYPEYEVLWSSVSQDAKSYDLSIAVNQVQEDAPIFAMPVELEITTTAGSLLDTIMLDDRQDLFRFTLADEPTGVDLDPDHWMLCEKTVSLVSDTTAPDAITDLTVALVGGAKSDSGDLLLSWSPSSDDVAVTGYVVYRSISAGALGDSLAGTTDTIYLDPGAVGDVMTHYYFTVKAVDWVSNKSEISNQVGEFDRELSNEE